ncbi:hypothetical protein E2C01_030246 [Portunus trituberculatus]|uniref:Uncharacterized protein n=1 Tax=Portunus trituberculatus TaxID=210409 RepID=A0A5B7EU85_PORTR|nr:hypothetical protein [Portunus trituberculatus]
MLFQDDDSNLRYQDEPFLPKGPARQSCGYAGSDDVRVTLPLITLVTMSNDPPHTTPQPLSSSKCALSPLGDHSYCQCLVHDAQRALVHVELFSPVPSRPSTNFDRKFSNVIQISIRIHNHR